MFVFFGIEKQTQFKANSPDKAAFMENRNGKAGIALDYMTGLRLE